MSAMAKNIVQALINEGWIVDNFEYSTTEEFKERIAYTIDDVLGLQDDKDIHFVRIETDEERSERITKKLNAEE